LITIFVMELHTDLPTDLSCTVISTSRLRCVFVHGLRTNGKSFPGPEVGLGAITTPSGVFQPEFVVHCLAESLLAAEIS